VCGTEGIRSYQLWLSVGCDSKLYMFPGTVVRFLNLLVMYLAACSFAHLAAINGNQ
jgi:hypothetical protein